MVSRVKQGDTPKNICDLILQPTSVVSPCPFSVLFIVLISLSHGQRLLNMAQHGLY